MTNHRLLVLKCEHIDRHALNGLGDPLKDYLFLLDERDAEHADGVREDFGDVPVRHLEQSVEQILDHVASILFEVGPQVRLGLIECAVLVELRCLRAEQIFLHRLEQLSDESV